MNKLSSIQTKKEFIDYLKSFQGNLTPTHRNLASYLIQNFTEVSFMRAQQWAHAVNTSEVSVIRFVRTLGFKGFSDFSEMLKKIIRQEMTMTDYIQISSNKPKVGDMDIFMEVIQAEKKNLNDLIQKYQPEVVSKVVEQIYEAEKIIIVGTRSSSPLAEYCDYMLLRAVGKDTLLLNTCGYQTFDSLIPLLDKKVLLIAFAFPRYPEKTMQIVEFLKNHCTSVIGITNDELSPLVPLSDLVLYAPSHSLAFTDSYGAANILINTVIMELIAKYPEFTEKIIPTFEQIAATQKYYRVK